MSSRSWMRGGAGSGSVLLLASVLVGCALVEPLDEAAPASEVELVRQSTVTARAGEVETAIEYTTIPQGTFTMGSPDDEDGRDEIEGPQHEVFIAAFQLGTYEVTNEQYARFLLANPSIPPPENWEYKLPKSWNAMLPNDSEDVRHWSVQPATGMTWEEASLFASWVGARLPTEAEWEYAARAGTTTARHGELDDVAWYDGNSDGVKHEVGTKQSNAWGLFDMLGNVYEWCLDPFKRYTSEPVFNPVTPPGSTTRILRSGSFADAPSYSRSAYRAVKLDHRSSDFGLRVVRVGGAPR